MLKVASCVMCIHLKDKVGQKPVCQAFPQGIPKSIIQGDDHHLAPIEGDQGIQYEPKQGLDFRTIFKGGE